MGEAKQSNRLVSIELLRGVAALMVAACHAFDHLLNDPPWLKPYVLLPITYGSSGVYLFFVVSGFCIHLRWARNKVQEQSTEIAFGAFWRRRFTRLYPAYLASLIICLFVTVRGQPVTNPAPLWWDITSHLMMLHNLDVRTVASINGVFWTLAVEEQLYLLYFVLLRLRVRYGWTVALATTVAVRFGWMALAGFLQHVLEIDLVVSLSTQAAWCIWALGALAVEASVGLVQMPTWTRSLPLAGTLFIAAASLTWQDGVLRVLRIAFQQPLYGVVAFIVVNAFVHREPVLRAGRSRWVRAGAWLGAISYSLYLMHQVAYALTTEGLLGMLAAIVLAAVFYQVFEKPFLGSKPPVAGAASHEPSAPATEMF